MKVGLGGSKGTLLYSGLIYNYRAQKGIGNALWGYQKWTPFGRAGQAATYYGRWASTGAIGVGGTISTIGFIYDY